MQSIEEIVASTPPQSSPLKRGGGNPSARRLAVYDYSTTPFYKGRIKTDQFVGEQAALIESAFGFALFGEGDRDKERVSEVCERRVFF